MCILGKNLTLHMMYLLRKRKSIARDDIKKDKHIPRFAVKPSSCLAGKSDQSSTNLTVTLTPTATGTPLRCNLVRANEFCNNKYKPRASIWKSLVSYYLTFRSDQRMAERTI